MQRINFHMGIMFLLLIFACKKHDNKGIPGENEIWLHNSRFEPSSKNISAGATVSFINKDNIAHTVSEFNNAFYSGNLKPGETFTYAFNSRDTFTFYCNYHNTMTGTLFIE